MLIKFVSAFDKRIAFSLQQIIHSLSSTTALEKAFHPSPPENIKHSDAIVYEPEVEQS